MKSNVIGTYGIMESITKDQDQGLLVLLLLNDDFITIIIYHYHLHMHFVLYITSNLFFTVYLIVL